ncbi:hypothetical protein Tco_0091838 [Tanacetum coccineum]
MCEFSIRVSRVSPSEVNKECLHRRFRRSESVEGSRGVSPSEVLARTTIGAFWLTRPEVSFEEGARLELGVSVGGCSTEGRVVSVGAGLDRRPLIKELDEEADTLPTIAPTEVPHGRNHIKSPRTQNTSTEDVTSYRGSEGVSEGRDAAMNELMGDKIGKELLHFAPSPYYMQYPYDEGLSSNPPNLKKELFKDPKVCKTILDRISLEGEMNLSPHSGVDIVPPFRRRLRVDQRVYSYQRLYLHFGGWIWYHRSGGVYELTRESAPIKDYTLTPGYGTTALEEAGNASPPHAPPVSSHLIAYTRERKGGYPRPSAMESISKGSGASGGGRTTPKKEARSSYSFHQKDGSARIVLDEHITEHAHEVRDIGCDSKLPLRESRRVRVGVYRRVTSYNFFESDTYNYLLEKPMIELYTREAYDVALAGEAYDVALAREAYDVTLAMEAYDVALLQDKSIVGAKLSSRGSTSIVGMYQTLSYVSKLSSRGIVRQCTSSDGDSAAPCLMRRLVTPDWLLLAS